MRKTPFPGKLIVGVILVPVAIGLIVAIPSLESLPGNEHSLFDNLLDLVLILFPVFLILGFVVYYKRQADIEENLKKDGIKGVAVVLSREQTGTYIDNLPQIRFRLRIILPGRDAYQIEHTDVVNLLDLHLIDVGAKLIVYVDPNQAENILLSFNKVES